MCQHDALLLCNACGTWLHWCLLSLLAYRVYCSWHLEVFQCVTFQLRFECFSMFYRSVTFAVFRLVFQARMFLVYSLRCISLQYHSRIVRISLLRGFQFSSFAVIIAIVSSKFLKRYSETKRRATSCQRGCPERSSNDPSPVSRERRQSCCSPFPCIAICVSLSTFPRFQGCFPSRDQKMFWWISTLRSLEGRVIVRS